MTWRMLVVALGLIALSGCGGAAGDASGDFIEVPGIGETRIDVPRPTGAASAPCDPEPLPPTSDESIESRVAALRAIGLFADRPDMDDVSVAAEVETSIVDQWGAGLKPDDPLMDLLVAEQDQERVWWRDLEADVTDGNAVYAATLQDWSAISQGAFEPEDIRETWASAEGPVSITFAMGSTTHEVSAAYFEDWIDPGVLASINDIEPSGRRFELYKAFDQTALVMALTDAERQGLEARGWCFE